MTFQKCHICHKGSLGGEGTVLYVDYGGDYVTMGLPNSDINTRKGDFYCMHIIPQ